MRTAQNGAEQQSIFLHQGCLSIVRVYRFSAQRPAGLCFVGFLDDVRQAVGKEVDLFDVTHIENGSCIDREIQQTGVTVYEK